MAWGLGREGGVQVWPAQAGEGDIKRKYGPGHGPGAKRSVFQAPL